MYYKYLEKFCQGRYHIRMYKEDIVLKQLGRNIKAERIKKGYTQEKFAELYCCDRDYISKVECGRQNLSIKKIIKIANCLNCRLEVLLSF